MTEDILDNNDKRFEEYLSRIPKRNEATMVCLGNIMRNEELNKESAFIAIEGLLDILFSDKRKYQKRAIESFGITLIPKSKSLNALAPQKTVGRPPDSSELKHIKEAYKDSDENVIYHDVLISFEKLKAKRSTNAPKISLSDAFRKVAKERKNNESPKSISVKFYNAKKRLELL